MTLVLLKNYPPTKSKIARIWFLVGDIAGWLKFQQTVPTSLELFVIEGVRGGHTVDEVEGDIAVDDIFVLEEACANCKF